MKRFGILIILLVAGWNTIMNAEILHRLGGKVDLHYVHSLLNLENQGKFGLGTTAGFAYEAKINNLLWQTGVDLSYTQQTIKNISYFGSLGKLFDEESDQCVYTYRLDDKVDNQHRLTIDIPIMIGAQIKSFYLLGGLKGRFCFYDNITTRAGLSTTGEYDNLIVPLQNMDNHYFWNARPIENKRAIDIYGEILAGCEAGIEIPSHNFYSQASSHCIHRISVFFDYTLFSSLSVNLHPLIDFRLKTNSMEDIQFEKIQIESLCFSDKQLDDNFQYLSIGIKWTVLLELPPSGNCMCK